MGAYSQVVTSSTYEIKLEVFEGPFQLLLSLIGEQKVDVCDIPIAKLTEGYLTHLAEMERADLDVTTEFLVVAATLLALKAKVLLPRPSSFEDDEEEELERDLLIARLFEVQTFRSVGEHLSELLVAGDRRYPPAPSPDDEALRRLPALADIAPADLARTLIEIIQQTQRSVDTSKIVVDQVSTQEAAAELSRILEDGPRTFASLAGERSLAWSVALFLAVLELAMRGELELGEGMRLGDLELRLVRRR